MARVGIVTWLPPLFVAPGVNMTLSSPSQSSSGNAFGGKPRAVTPSPSCSPEPTLSAQYVRMSTEHQQYSTANQIDAIRQYAENRNLRIVRTYADEGKSGLNLTGRPGLQHLLADVESPGAGFEAVLVYDISRWGRFQDADESAYYEYRCKRKGVAVHYCAEQFDNDGGPMATVIKSLKRAMAAEYSRELSTKVFQGKCRLIELGYRQGGTPGYGLRRMLVDASGTLKGELTPGQWKSLQTDRVILTPGPEEEVRVIHQIYDLFINHRQTFIGIARLLNAEGIGCERGRPWTRETVREVLTNEKYIGNNIFNRHSAKLKVRQVRNQAERWIRKDGAFSPVIDIVRFRAAQEIINAPPTELTDGEMIDCLRILVRRHGKLSGDLIDADKASPHHQAYIRRFGSLRVAYRLAGYTPRQRYEYLNTNDRMILLREEVADGLVRNLELAGATVTRPLAPHHLEINKHFKVLLLLARRNSTLAGSPRWVVQLKKQFPADVTAIGRMDSTNTAPAEFFLLPSHELARASLLRTDDTGMEVDAFRHPNLTPLVALAQRHWVE